MPVRHHHRSHHRHHHHHHYGRRRIVVVPPSTDRTIVFPYNFSQRKFNTSHYVSAMTNNAAGNEEVGQFLAEIERLLIPYHKAAGQRLIRIMACGIFVLFIVFAITIPVAIISANSSSKSSPSTTNYVSGPGYGYYETTSSSSSSSFPIAIPVVFGILFAYMIIFMITNIVLASRGRTKLVEVKQSVSAYIAQRAAEYKEKGLAWTVPVDFPYWIELWRTDSMQPAGFYPGMQMQQPFFGAPNMYNPDAMYSRPGETVMMMQPMQMQQIQMQPMQMQMQPQQAIYMQNQYNANPYGNYNV